MNTVNNFKLIREIYGATQEEIATAVNVNRSTVSNWEKGTSKASAGKLEQLSIFFGIGPEYFYEKELEDAAKEQIIETAQRQQEVENEGARKKSKDFQDFFGKLSFSQALDAYVQATKCLLAVSDDATVDRMELACKLNDKLGQRLHSKLRLLQEEKDSNEDSLMDLVRQLQQSVEADLARPKTE